MILSKWLGSDRSSKLAIAAGALFAIVGVAYLLKMLAGQTLESMDFRYVWLAGDLWGQGGNPYGQGYIDAGARQFPTGYPIAAWAYPFHWYLPARLAALLPPAPAFTCWLVVTTVALAGAGWLVMAAARAAGVKPAAAMVLLGIGYIASGAIVGYALRAGQPAVVAQCGVALTLFGVARGRVGWTGIGLALAMLKPQIGLPFATAVCFMPRGFPSAVLGAILVLVASLPAFLASGFGDQLYGLLMASRGSYQSVSYNTATMMAGLPHLLEIGPGWPLSILGSMILAASLTALAAWGIRRRPAPERIILFVGLTTSITGAVVGLHTYDLVIVLFAMPFLSRLSPPGRLVAVIAYALLWRPETLVVKLTGDTALLPTVQSFALMLLLAAWVVAAMRRTGASTP